LQIQFEQYSTRDSKVFPLGEPSKRADGETGYRRFAVLSVDELLFYEDDAVQWTESLARPLLEQVEAALGSEKSLSKVISFLPQIAQQTKNSAIFAIVVAFAAIVAYLWLRFGTKEYGLAAIVALVHDVTVTLGLVALSHYVYDKWFGKALLITDFKIDLSMVAAILTVIGYSLNDTIVVFDRIRENRGRIGSLNPGLINNSLNQTLSRTLLTSTTTFLVVFILYVWGGKGVHGFSFALLIGVVVGTYSSLGVATPLLYRPRLLRAVVVVIAALGLIGIVLAEVEGQKWRLIWCGAIAASCAGFLARGQMSARRHGGGVPAAA
ncbi:MAG: protein translocase subunit SecF, partial [Planctomycetes bacterium]|nr:protein translocase subunit SecF [Planctomycetota bacterium]